MKSTFSILFYLRSNRTDKDGKSAIQVRITIDGEITTFNSKLSIPMDLWNSKAGKVTGKSMEARQINFGLDQIRACLSQNYWEIFERESTVTPEKVKNAYLGITNKEYSLLKQYEIFLQDTEKLVGINKSKNTLQKYKVAYKHLKNFLYTRYKLSDIALKDIGHKFITDFEIYLRTTANCSNNTTYKFMQFFKRIIIIARNNGWIYIDPFANYKIRIEKVDRGYWKIRLKLCPVIQLKVITYSCAK